MAISRHEGLTIGLTEIFPALPLSRMAVCAKPEAAGVDPHMGLRAKACK